MFLLDVDGASAPLSLFPATTTSVVHDYQWSPDGSRIAFLVSDGPANLAGKELHVVPVTASGFGTPLKVSGVTLDTGAIRWSPDGSKLAFVAAISSSHTDVFVVDVSGATPGQRYQLNAPVPVDEGHFLYLKWSPDGQWISFTGDRGKEHFYHTDVAKVGTLPPGPPVRVSPTITATQPTASSYIGAQGEPEWAGDSTRLAFSANAAVYGTSELFVAAWIAGTPTPGVKVFAPSVGGTITRYAWSHDGTRLAFVDTHPNTQSMQLHVLPFTGIAAGTALPLLQGSYGGEYSWNWSPTSRLIAARMDVTAPSVYEAFLIDANSWPPTPPLDISGIQDDDDVTTTPSWSPDGKFIFFGMNKTYPDGGAVVEVTASGVNPPLTQGVCGKGPNVAFAPNSTWMGTIGSSVTWSKLPPNGAMGQSLSQGSYLLTFTPDSSRVLFLGNTDGSGQRIFIADNSITNPAVPLTPPTTDSIDLVRFQP